MIAGGVCGARRSRGTRNSGGPGRRRALLCYMIVDHSILYCAILQHGCCSQWPPQKQQAGLRLLDARPEEKRTPLVIDSHDDKLTNNNDNNNNTSNDNNSNANNNSNNKHMRLRAPCHKTYMAWLGIKTL